jgi:diguanylate cyclase (GGDEF)-like protein/PAS domain S-box-containing protein
MADELKSLITAAPASSRPTPGQILDLLPGLIAYFGPDLRYRYANATYARWRGLAPDAILGKYVREIVGERNYPLIVERLRMALAGEDVTYQYHIFDGEHRRLVQGHYVPDVDADGHVVGVVVMVTDIGQRDELELSVAHSEAMFDEAFENAPIGKAMVGIDGKLIRSNPALAAMVGRTVEEMAGLSIAEITHPEDVEADLIHFNEVLDKRRDGYCMGKRYIHRDGSYIHAKLAVSAVRDDLGEVVRFFAHVEDVTQQREAERKLVETNARLSLVTEAIHGGSWHMDIATGHFETSGALAEFVLGSGAFPLDMSGYTAHIHPEDRDKTELQALIEGKVDRSSVEYRLLTHTGTHWMRCDRRLLRDHHGRPEQLVGVAIDMTDEHERRTLAEVQASTDPLTGLLNRRGLEQRLRGLSPDCACGLILVDLDGFKQVNDQLGHDAGDAVLIEAADRLRTIVRSGDLVARLGGDEFAMVLVGSDLAGLKSLADRAVASLQGGFQACAEAGLWVSASLGVAWSAKPPIAQQGSMSRADKALYQAKAAGRGTWRLAA